MINIHDLDIANVTQNYYDETRIDINFYLINSHYQLHVRKNEKGVFQPFNIYHIKKTGKCLYCDGSEGGCRGLGMHINELFLRLIEFPSIRLEWLYLPHAVKA